MFVIARWAPETEPFWSGLRDDEESAPAPLVVLDQGLLARVRVTPDEAVRVCAWARRRMGDVGPDQAPLRIADATGRSIWPPPRRPA
jgi:hypothetical protein